MRHQRSSQFEKALTAAATSTATTRWNEASTDPNDPRALASRAETLRRAWRPPVSDRIAFLAARCGGRSVLDIGCVAHDEARMDSPNWLHAHLAAAASRCVGLDVLEDGVAAMRARGFEAVVHDLRSGLGPLLELAPFGTIVAGELIEHIGDLDMLFAAAAQALSEDGQLIITTPNPYAPRRVRAGQRGLVWENVDHILYAFPSGVAELAERHGLTLSEAMTTSDDHPRTTKEWLKDARRAVRGTRWRAAGFTTKGDRAAKLVSDGPLTRLSPGRLRSWFLGETFIYVVSRPPRRGTV